MLKKEGWIYVSISGNAFQRGFDYGKKVKGEMPRIKEILNFYLISEFKNKKKNWDYFSRICKQKLELKIKTHFQEFYEEMKGFSRGCGEDIFSLDDVLFLNNYITVTEYMMPPTKTQRPSRCSAFMAVGDEWTRDGKIVMAHNTFSEFLEGQLFHCVLDIQPDSGSRICFTTIPGMFWSGTDVFVTSNGFMGTETTIGSFNKYEDRWPISCRIRKAMQYAKTLDDFTTILLENNSGDYANSWLIGNIHTNEIMRLEVGLKYHSVEKTKNGYFIGFNGVYDERIRERECSKDTGFYDIQSGRGARRVRLEQLMLENKGKLDLTASKAIISDHYDPFLGKEEKSSRTICGHYELDDARFSNKSNHTFLPFQPRGAVDGCVCDSVMAKKMSFLLRWGNSCGTPFSSTKYLRMHPRWRHYGKYLLNRPTRKWINVIKKRKTAKT
jgi:hypothetical protein